MTQSLRELLLRRLNQAFWLILLMSLAGWGAWRFSRLATPANEPMQTNRIDREFQQLHLQAITSLDSSVNGLRLAVMSGESEPVLLALTEQLRQQAQEVALLSSSRETALVPPSSVIQPLLLDQCQKFRQLLHRKAPVRLLSQHLAEFQSQVRHLQYRVAGDYHP